MDHRRGNRIDYTDNPYPEEQLLNEAQNIGDWGDDEDNCEVSVEDGVGGGKGLRLDPILSSGGELIYLQHYISDINFPILHYKIRNFDGDAN